MAAPSFDMSPEQQAGVLHFMRQQLTFKPEIVRGINLGGKTAIVTGSSSGVGLEVGRQLLDLGLSKLILAVRNESKGEKAVAELAAGRSPPLAAGTIEVWKLDLDSYDSIAAFAERTKSLERLDYIFLNAGLCLTQHTLNEKTGHESVIQVNYLSTALLAILLLPVVKAKRAKQTDPTRITFSSSEVSAWASLKADKDTSILKELDTPPPKYDGVAYMMTSKLLGQYFISELAKRVPSSIAIINGASPGSIHDSQFNREVDKTFAGAIIKRILRVVANTSAVGARMVTDAGVRHGAETHGQFLSFQKLVPMAPILYTEEGSRISAQLWKETMDELSFAQPEAILNEVAQG